MSNIFFNPSTIFFSTIEDIYFSRPMYKIFLHNEIVRGINAAYKKIMLNYFYKIKKAQVL
jgi:hypothetical protein